MAARNNSKSTINPSLPPSHLEALDAAGFTVLRWQRRPLHVRRSDGSAWREYLPMDSINWERRQFIRWCEEDDTHSFAGWEPQIDSHFGGRYDTVHGALSWFEERL